MLRSVDKILKSKSPKTTLTTTYYTRFAVSLSNKYLSSCVSSSTITEYIVQGIHCGPIYLQTDKVFTHT